MNTLKYIRIKVFKIASQGEFAAAINVAQSTISRWERGTKPSIVEMEKIRECALGRGIKWKDVWFFEVPQAKPEFTGVTG